MLFLAERVEAEMQQMPVVGRIRSLRQRSSRRAQLFSDIAKLMRLGHYWLLFYAFLFSLKLKYYVIYCKGR